MVYFYSDFIEKLIRAGRNDGTKPYFKIGEDIDRDDFITYANKFIENYYATVPQDFTRKHPMKFSFGIISQDGRFMLNRTITTEEIELFPQYNGGILFLEIPDGKEVGVSTLDGSVYRQACFIQRENRKFLAALAVAAAAVVTLAFSLVLR